MPEPTDRNGLAARLAALVAAGLAATIAWRYPLLPWLAFLVLAAYAAALWRWPLLWLVAVPAALPALDLGPWSGWTFVEEPDAVVLTSVAVLLLRAPPRRGDFRLAGLPGLAVALAAASCLAGVGMALARGGLGGASAIAELSPLDPLRVAKGLGAALLLLPFLRRAFREHADAPWRLAVGMALGLGAVAAAALAERVLFVQLFAFDTMYRIVGPFSSMHFGGGYIGAYVAMALPFLFVPAPRGRRVMAVVSFLIAVGALYTLVVTYSRAAYASALIAGVAAGAGQLFVALRGRVGVRALALPAVLLLAVGAAVATAATDARFMEWRLGHFRPDLDRRVREWRAGLALGDPGAATAL
ncbi:MAG TPA: hypothetical protein VFA22_02230, partial [Stellaceae bacterium]|nr:hypothetical protein [Stellaceae bacterium]